MRKTLKSLNENQQKSIEEMKQHFEKSLKSALDEQRAQLTDMQKKDMISIGAEITQTKQQLEELQTAYNQAQMDFVEGSKKFNQRNENLQQENLELKKTIQDSKQYQLKEGVLKSQFDSERSAYETMIVQLKNQVVEKQQILKTSITEIEALQSQNIIHKRELDQERQQFANFKAINWQQVSELRAKLALS